MDKVVYMVQCYVISFYIGASEYPFIAINHMKPYMEVACL